jgi:hypothetical protein
MISEYTKPPADNNSKSNAMFSTTATKPMIADYAASRQFQLFSREHGANRVPTREARKSTSTMPITMTIMPPSSLGKYEAIWTRNVPTGP